MAHHLRQGCAGVRVPLSVNGARSNTRMRRVAKLALVSLLVAACAALGRTSAQQIQGPLPSIDRLIAVVREAPGLNHQEEALRPVGRIKTVLPWATREVELEPSWFDFLGDMKICLFFEGNPSALENVLPSDLDRFNLTPEEALEIAVANFKRLNGPPLTFAMPEGPIRVYGEFEHFDSSYFLDRQFWREQLQQHPEGIVVGVPKRHALVFAPLADTNAVEYLRENVPAWHGDPFRVSSALYLFKDDRWSVFQAPEADAER